MSSPQQSRELGNEQQTLEEAVVAQKIREFPRGIILRVELPSDKFEAFLRGNRLVTYVMVNFSDVKDVLDKYGSLDAVLEPWHVPIVTATEDDALIRDRTRNNIRRILGHIHPAIYIPDTGTVYVEDSTAEQRGGIQEYKTRLNWLVEEIHTQGWEIELLPLAKGNKQWHFQKYIDLFDRHGFQNFAFYTRQYCGGDIGNRINDLVDHINNFITVVDPANILAIARHGETHLRKLPPRVTGASGLKQVIKNCTTDNGMLSTDMFAEWQPRREDALFANHDHTQPKLNEYGEC